MITCTTIYFCGAIHVGTLIFSIPTEPVAYCNCAVLFVFSPMPISQEGSRSSERETQILIPQPFMGTLIGTGGSKINELRRVRLVCLVLTI